jgi:hypothetical protein
MKSSFLKETDLCAAFIAALPPEWTAYPETGGFDILLVRKQDGFQIGIEAKLKLNAKVIAQAAEDMMVWYSNYPGPDCRAVLIPDNASGEMEGVCHRLGLGVIRVLEPEPQHPYMRSRDKFRPSLPNEQYGDENQWFQFAPAKRVSLPEWVPDVEAGASAPTTLSQWKVKAIKIAITLEKRGYVTRKDFKHFNINMTRWTIPGASWLVKDGKGGWVAGPQYPDFRLQHPVNFDQIASDYENWKNPDQAATQQSLGLRRDRV